MGASIILAALVTVLAEGLVFLALDIAHAIVPALLLPSLLVGAVIVEGAYIERCQTRPNDVAEDELDKVIGKLEDLHVDVWYSGKLSRESMKVCFEEAAGMLASGGITPVKGEWKWGMNSFGLTRLLSRLRIEGIVDVSRVTEERDRGYPEVVERFFLSDFGAKVMRRMEEKTYALAGGHE